MAGNGKGEGNARIGQLPESVRWAVGRTVVGMASIDLHERSFELQHGIGGHACLRPPLE
jgi:hypothetical protein